jgi:hypothetical protein
MGLLQCAAGLPLRQRRHDFAPVVEATPRRELGWRLPEIGIVPPENMGIAMAHGSDGDRKAQQ